VENSLSFQEIGSQKLCFVCPDWGGYNHILALLDFLEAFY
jgi:hypothetical protein